MVDISVTATAVVPGSNASIQHGWSGATITAGKVVYKEAATGKYKLADSNGVGEIKTAAGIALNAASDGQPISIITAGDMTMNAALVGGSVYYLSETPGGIEIVADVAAADVVIIGVAKSTTVLTVGIRIPGVTLA